MPSTIAKTHELPIDEVIPAFLEAVVRCRSVILSAPPGAGKTTRVPLALLDIVSAESGRILMLEPRRIAAVSAAVWMATCLGEKTGETVGYSVRFDSCTSSSTRIEVVTEGILTRRIQNDPELKGVSLVVFDEFHERSIHADLGLVLCKEVQQLRQDLKIIVMSATLDLEPLSSLLDDAPVISSGGRRFPVEIKYLDNKRHDPISKMVKSAVVMAMNETAGDVLVFLPGIGEIRKCAELLMLPEVLPENTEVCKLYGDLPVHEQQKIIQSGPYRKVVLATSIAETSLTIDGVRAVIDCGESRRLQYDPGSGLNRLVTVRESRASAEQRAGRAGRTAPGVCYRLYSAHTLQTMSQHTPPEILVTDLSQLMLELAAWGVKDPLALDWLDAPPAAARSAARQLLADLDLVYDDGVISALGREAVKMPVHPRLGRLMIRSGELGCRFLGCQLAALLSERDIFGIGRDDLMASQRSFSITDRLDALNNRYTAEYNDIVNIHLVKRVERVVSQLARQMCVPITEKNLNHDNEIVSRLLLAAYPDRLASRRDGDGGGYLLASGRGARFAQRNAAVLPEFIIAVALDAGTQADALIHLAEGVSASVVRQERSVHIRCETSVEWDSRELRITAKRSERIGSVVLESENAVPAAAETLPVLVAAVRASGLTLLAMDYSVRQLQSRWTLVRTFFPELGMPDVSDRALLETVEEWLSPYMGEVNSARKLAQLDIADILIRRLEYRQRRSLDELAPTHMPVPSGSRVKIDYSGESPVLAVKLQELFGLAESPAICDGRIKLLLHLLSPAGRPIQVTGDLEGFWNGTYQQVKKELKGRYPKHPWPDDPWSAAPTRRLKPKGT